MKKIMGRAKDGQADAGNQENQIDLQSPVIEELIEEKIRRILAESGMEKGKQQPQQPLQTQAPQAPASSQQSGQQQLSAQGPPQRSSQQAGVQQGQIASFTQTEAQISSQLEQNLQRLKNVIRETQKLAQKMESLLGAASGNQPSS